MIPEGPVGGAPVAAASGGTAVVSCIQCGYDLAGLPATGSCPECGRPVRSTVAAESFPEWSTPALRRLRMALRLVWMYGAAVVAAFFAVVVLPAADLGDLAVMAAASILLAGLGVSAWAWRRVLRSGPGHDRRLAVWRRISMAGAIGAAISQACVMVELVQGPKGNLPLLEVGILGHVFMLSLHFAAAMLGFGRLTRLVGGGVWQAGAAVVAACAAVPGAAVMVVVGWLVLDIRSDPLAFVASVGLLGGVFAAISGSSMTMDLGDLARKEIEHRAGLDRVDPDRAVEGLGAST